MYSIRWTHRALVLLGTLWVNASETEREDILSALSEVIEILGNHPETIGESRAGNERVVFVPPLGLQYHVIRDDELVEIGRVWRIDRR